MSETELVRKFSRLLNEVAGLLKLLNREDRICCGLTMPQAFCIEALYERGPLTMGELASTMGIAVSTLTRMLDILVRDGLVMRGKGKNDRRHVGAGLTKAGIGAAEQFIACRDAAMRGYIEAIPESKLEILVETMEILKTSIVKAKSCCCAGSGSNDDHGPIRIAKERTNGE